jgi:hypothetical protein
VRYKIVRREIEGFEERRKQKCRHLDIPHLSSIRGTWVHDARCMDIAKSEASPMLRARKFRLQYTERVYTSVSYLYVR